MKDKLPPLPKECIYAFSSGLPAAVMSAYYSGDQMREYAEVARQQTAAKCAKICEDLIFPSGLYDSGSAWDCATLDCESAIKARFGLDATEAEK
jgi:hypothetical protein